MFKIQETYKIKTKTSFYTATILEEEENFIVFEDKYGEERGLNKLEILDFKKL